MQNASSDTPPIAAPETAVPPAVDADWTPTQLQLLKELQVADRLRLKQIYCDLSPPSLESFQGEFDAHLLNQDGWLSTVLIRAAFRSRGKWVGKAFRQTGENEGTGYNCFLDGDRIIGGLEMDTTIGASWLDGLPSLLIIYRRRHGGLLRWFDGEVRHLTDNLYLGMGLFGPRIEGHSRWQRKIPFLLIGPRRPYQTEF